MPSNTNRFDAWVFFTEFPTTNFAEICKSRLNPYGNCSCVASRSHKHPAKNEGDPRPIDGVFRRGIGQQNQEAAIFSADFIEDRIAEGYRVSLAGKLDATQTCGGSRGHFVKRHANRLQSGWG